MQRIVQLFDDFNSFDGMFSFLGAIIENGAGESLVTAVGGRAPMARTIEVFEKHHKIKGYSQTCLLWWSRFAKTSKIVAAAVCTISLRRPWLHPQSGKTVSSALKMAVLSGVYHRSGKECQSRIAGMALYLMSFTEKCFFFPAGVGRPSLCPTNGLGTFAVRQSTDDNTIQNKTLIFLEGFPVENGDDSAAQMGQSTQRRLLYPTGQHLAQSQRIHVAQLIVADAENGPGVVSDDALQAGYCHDIFAEKKFKADEHPDAVQNVRSAFDEQYCSCVFQVGIAVKIVEKVLSTTPEFAMNAEQKAAERTSMGVSLNEPAFIQDRSNKEAQFWDFPRKLSWMSGVSSLDLHKMRVCFRCCTPGSNSDGRNHCTPTDRSS